MKTAALLFLTLLIAFHCLDGGSANLDRPLSMFREDGLETVGYLLFGLLLGLGGPMIAVTVRLKHYGGAVVFSLGGLLLLVVAGTPSLGELHNLCAFGLLGLLYFYYAGLLLYAGGFGVLVHLAAPVVLVFATQFHSYGLWQKSLIAYFVIALVIHHHVLTRMRHGSFRPNTTRGGKPLESSKKRRVYSLEPGKAWARRKLSLDPSSA